MTRAGAMVLAAGRGERMRPLTDHTPKPLLTVGGKPLMQWPLEALARSGVDRVVVNTGWLGDRIPAHFGTAPPLGPAGPMHLLYSHEGRGAGEALETAGGIVRALPLLDEVFWVVAGDVYAPQFVFSPEVRAGFVASGRLAHLWLVPNPEHHPQGDFGITPEGLAQPQAARQYTFSTIGLYRQRFFAPPYCDVAPGNPEGRALRLAPLLRAAMADDAVSAELYTGPWTDVGTPERLATLDKAA